MPNTQANRLLEIKTALGPDALLLTGFSGQEAMSELFAFRLEMLAETEILFDGIVGQEANVEIRLGNGDKRFLNGIIKSFAEGPQDEIFVHYRAELVPKQWLLSRNLRSRIFQQVSVPDILRDVLKGYDVAYELNGTYPERDYCVQYCEPDFAFISRLMEEEGIYFFFKHSDGAHQMIITDANSRQERIKADDGAIVNCGPKGSGGRDEWRIWHWEKSQQLRAGEYTLWDHSFELPGNPLEIKENSIETVNVGAVSHTLALPANRDLEIYEFPGGYAGRFDGVDRNGVPRPERVSKIFEERTRVGRLRMEAEECASLLIQGAGNDALFSPGQKFSLARHFSGNGEYLLTRVEHHAKLACYQNDTGGELTYENKFECIPDTLQYRPPRVTAKPVVYGVQTATVAGPAGEEIFTDKYGRVKVHFHWDREGKKDASSSCWIRVAQVWAGNGWGAFFWPRIGHEVVIGFENGDPDQPLIVGSVYNAENMPPFNMPAQQQRGGIKSESFRGLPTKNYNAIVFHDEKDNEHLAFHSERHMVFNAEWDKMFRTGRSHGESVPQARTVSVGRLPNGGGN